MSQKRIGNWACAAAFLAVCVGVLLFLQRFTQSENSFVYPAWETGAVVSAEGAQTPFDPAGLPPELEEGERYRYTMTLPEGREGGTFLVFETTGMETAVFLGETELWYSAADQSPETVNQSQVHLPLPVGGGETLTMDLRPLSDLAIVPPILRLTDDPTDEAGAIAYANYYGLPAGASALALVLLWGLFLLSLSQGRRNWLLLLPVLAAALLTLRRLTMGYGLYFLPQAVQDLGSHLWLEWLAALALALYLVVRRDRVFWRALGRCTAWSAGALVVLGLLSHLRDGYLARYLAILKNQLQAGIWSSTLYWLIWWLVLVCALLAAWDLLRSMAQTQGEARALVLRNRLILESYHDLERKLREGAKQRHEQNHQLAALDAMLQSGDLEGLRRELAAWRQAAIAVSPALYTKNIPFNAMLQDAAARAREIGAAFRAAVVVPEQLAIPDTDLCTLLMNLFDNALEGAARTPEGRERYIVFKARVVNGLLFLSCENTFDGQVKTDGHGRLKTIKSDADIHGFGLTQMRAVAEKYKNILDIRYTEEVFTVQTALKIPQAPAD